MASSDGKKGTTITPYLSFDVIYKFLLYLPVEFLVNCARNVCKEWRKVTQDSSFIEEHLQRSKDALFFYESSQEYGSSSMYKVYEDNGGLLKKPLGVSFPGAPVDGCRGLCLFLGNDAEYASVETENYYRLHVVNPATKQIQKLPSLGSGGYMCCHLAFISQSKEYKVVCCFSTRGVPNWFVCTLGTDVCWRQLLAVPRPTQNLARELFRPTSVTVGQFLYFSECRSKIVGVNLHDETISSVQLSDGYIRRPIWLLRKGGTLCFLAPKGRTKRVSTWVVRFLEDFELIEDGGYMSTATGKMLLPFSPLGWLGNGPIFVSEASSWIITREIARSAFVEHFEETRSDFEIDISRDAPFHGFLIHTNSLVIW